MPDVLFQDDAANRESTAEFRRAGYADNMAATRDWTAAFLRWYERFFSQLTACWNLRGSRTPVYHPARVESGTEASNGAILRKRGRNHERAPKQQQQ